MVMKTKDIIPILYGLFLQFTLSEFLQYSEINNKNNIINFNFNLIKEKKKKYRLNHYTIYIVQYQFSKVKRRHSLCICPSCYAYELKLNSKSIYSIFTMLNRILVQNDMILENGIFNE